MLYGRHVMLRPLEEADLPLLVRWRNDPQTRTMFRSPLPLMMAGQRRWYEGLLGDPTRIYFMIEQLSDNAVIGMVALQHIDFRNQQAEAGPIMLDPGVRGHDYSVDAVRTMFRYAFQELNLRRLYGTVIAFNTASRRMNERVGLKQEGVEREAAFVDGAFHDVIRYGMLRDEWVDEEREG